MAYMKRTLVFGLALFLLGCGAQASSGEPNDSGTRADASSIQGCVSYRVEVDSKLDPSWPSAIEGALGKWNEALQGKLPYEMALTDAPHAYSDPAPCVVAFQADAHLLDEEDAAGFTDPTLINSDGQRFGHVRLLPGPRPPDGAMALAVHELGHFIGLQHSNELGSVMHLPLAVPACMTDSDVASACQLWSCPEPALPRGRCLGRVLDGGN